MLVISIWLELQRRDKLRMKEFKCAKLEKRKLKFNEFYGRYEIMGDVSTNRCPYTYEQDRTTKLRQGAGASLNYSKVLAGRRWK